MSIKFLLDENIPYALIDLLQKRGFDAKDHGDVLKLFKKRS
jgi:hypothetical protein